MSGFVQYFCEGMAKAFAKALSRAEAAAGIAVHPGQATWLRELRPLQRQALGLFVQTKVMTASEVAWYLGISPRQGRELYGEWIDEGFLIVKDPSKKARSYSLADSFEERLT